MELRHLRYFMAVAEEMHFGRAAQKLYVVQPAVSKQIAALERELGFELFSRTKRRVELTPAGAAFVPEIRDILARIDRAVEHARDAAKGYVGNLAVGFIGPAMDSVLPRILPMYRERYPEVRISLDELTTAAQLTRLRDGSLDIGLLRLPIDDTQVEVRPILAERMVIALHENDPLTQKPAVEMTDVVSAPFVMIPRSEEAGLHDTTVALCRMAGFSPTVVQEARGLHSLLGLVAAGMGVTLVPESVENLARAGVVYRPIADSHARLELAVAWPVKSVSRPAELLLEMLEDSPASD